MAKKKSNNPNKIKYHGSKIKIVSKKAEDQLKIDSKSIKTSRDADTGAYVCESLPYQTFGTLEALGKAVVDSKQTD